jgi:hypothetical protein
VFLSSDGVTLGAVSIAQNQPAPAAGQAIAAAASQLSSVSVGPDQTVTSITSAAFPSAGTGYEFVSGSLTVPLADGFGAAGGLAQVRASVSAGADSLAGKVQLIEPEPVSVVPTTALVTGSSGDTCVYPYAADLARAVPLVVTPVGGLPGMTNISRIDLDQVLANPADLTGLVSCP